MAKYISTCGKIFSTKNLREIRKQLKDSDELLQYDRILLMYKEGGIVELPIEQDLDIDVVFDEIWQSL